MGKSSLFIPLHEEAHRHKWRPLWPFIAYSPVEYADSAKVGFPHLCSHTPLRAESTPEWINVNPALANVNPATVEHSAIPVPAPI